MGKFTYRCTDCGREMPPPGGTCDDCKVASQPEPEKPGNGGNGGGK